MEHNYSFMSKEEWRNNEKFWKLGLFYFNKQDKRLLVPKRNYLLGWTINFANIWSILTGLLLLIALTAIIMKIR
jgi:hypothetical protein